MAIKRSAASAMTGKSVYPAHVASQWMSAGKRVGEPDVHHTVWNRALRKLMMGPTQRRAQQVTAACCEKMRSWGTR